MKLSCKKVPRIVKVMCQLKRIKKTKPEDITRLFLLSASYVLRAVLSINLLLCLLLSCSSYGFYSNFIAEHFNTLQGFSPLTSPAVSIEVYIQTCTGTLREENMVFRWRWKTSEVANLSPALFLSLSQFG